MRLILLAAALAAADPAAGADQALPACAELNRLWRGEYRRLLKPQWPAADLACAKGEAGLSYEEMRDLDTARAAYVLSETRWTSTALPGAPLVQGGGIEPPPNMLHWIAARSRGLYDDSAGSAYADQGDNTLHLARADFTVELGVNLAGQLIHEARHLAGGGFPAYGHVPCMVGGQNGAPNCDPTIAEDFGGGGSHAVAVLWLSWIANRSRWPAAARKTAEKTVDWVMKNRVNDAWAADQFMCRYMGYYVHATRQKCRR